MMNTNVLKAKMIEKGVKAEVLAETMGVSKTTFYRRLSNRGKVLTVGEAVSIAEKLNLTNADITAIFFGRKGQDMNYQNLWKIIKEKYQTNELFAKAMKKSPATVNRKLDGVTAFLQRDIVEWSKALEIDLRDAGKYFYDVAVDKMN